MRAFHLQITVLIEESSNASLNPCDIIIIFKFIFSTSQLASFLLLASLPLMFLLLLVLRVTGVHALALVRAVAGTLLQVFLLCWPYCYRRPYALALVHGVNMGFLQREWAIFFDMYG